MELVLRVVFFAMVLLEAPITSQGQEQCGLPTEEDVQEVYKDVLTTTTSESQATLVLSITQMLFTCLATVSLNQYSAATVLINFTTDVDSAPQIEQFQLRCTLGNVWGADPSSVFDDNVPSMPFNIIAKNQCSGCLGTSSSADYDAATNCLPCHADCLSIGGGFCTGDTADDCCPFFNSSNGDCVDDCTAINPDFGPDENFTCVCSIPCGPGYTRNTTTCSCEFTDGCEAAGQPCENGGTCISDVSAPAGGPYYNCTCANGFSGQNCTDCNISCDPGYTLDVTSCICELTDGCEASGQPCQNGGNCISDLSAPAGGPYYNCLCANYFSGQNCTVCSTSCDSGYTLNSTICSCELTNGCEAAGQPCQNGGTCVSDLSASPYYSCLCTNGSTGQNCSNLVTTEPTSTVTSTEEPSGESSGDNGTLIAVIVVVVIVVVLLLVIVTVVIAVFAYQRWYVDAKKKKTEKSTTPSSANATFKPDEEKVKLADNGTE